MYISTNVSVKTTHGPYGLLRPVTLPSSIPERLKDVLTTRRLPLPYLFLRNGSWTASDSVQPHQYVTQSLNHLVACLPFHRSRWLSGRTPDCGARVPRFESHRGRSCLSRQSLRYTALGTGCAPLLQCLGRLSLPPSVGR